MSAAMQAIINGARAAALWASRATFGPRAGWGSPQLVIRPRGRRQALVLCQDA